MTQIEQMQQQINNLQEQMDHLRFDRVWSDTLKTISNNDKKKPLASILNHRIHYRYDGSSVRIICFPGFHFDYSKVQDELAYISRILRGHLGREIMLEVITEGERVL